MDFLSKFESAINFLVVLAIVILILDLLLLITFVLKYKIPRKIRISRAYKIIPFVILGLNIGSAVLAFFTLRYNFTKSPEVIAKFPNTGETWTDLSKPMVVLFDRPVQEKELEHSIFPEIKGEWKVENVGGLIKFPRKVVFYPKESFPLDQKITTYFTKVRNLWANQNGFDHEDSFQTPKTPSISTTDPVDGSEKVPVSAPIALRLDNPDGPYADWKITVEPQVDFKVEDTDEKTKIIKFDKLLSQNTEYTVTVGLAPVIYSIPDNQPIKKDELAEIKKLKFKTVPNPTITNSSPSGDHVLIDSKVTIVFNDEMDQDSIDKNFDMSPAVDGKINWSDLKTMVFTPSSPLTKATKYTVSLKPGIKSKIGGVIESAIQFDFSTIGAAYVKRYTPDNGANGSSVYSQMTFEFDQEVDHASAQSKFSISPSTAGSFSWSGNTMTYKPSGTLGFSTKYSISLGSGVKSTNGLDSKDNYNFSFTTQPEKYLLKVPQDYQSSKYDCNLTAIRMALEYRGVSVNQDQIVAGIGYASPQDRSGNYWGNPNVGYVGYRNGPGYGVHWGPASTYISKFRSNKIYTGWSVQGIANEIKNGNPVILWWNNGLSGDGPDSWNSPQGSVSAYIGMHSEVVIGFYGTVENPTSFITNDPWRGAGRQYSTSYFKSLWSTFNNTAIAVY